jgi:hypothetical protein
VVSALAFQPARAQISPGPLARPHAALEGAANCLRCHASERGGSIDRRCQACHTEIAWQTEQGSGLHGREKLEACARCHPDHAGADFELIDWGRTGSAGFEHERSGFALGGRHAEIECRDCHKKVLQSPGAVEGLERKLTARSWLGMPRDCAGCHKDVHRGTLGADCASCHGDRAWKPASKFDHARSAFPLAGKHAAVACARCHATTDPALGPRYKPLPHAECSACHEDPHAGRLGPGCAACHVAAGFRIIERSKFDHERTRYQLRGKHRGVECARCHARQVGGERPPFARCEFCHRDAHAGRATRAGAPADCAACHAVQGFAPATYSAADHERTDYPLAGAHRRVACAKCHVKNPSDVPRDALGTAGVLLRPQHRSCRDCHAEAHASQFVSRADRGACEGCHTVEAFVPSTFTVAQHASTRFVLSGRHAAVRCADCHGPKRPGLPALPPAERIGTAGVALAGLPGACEACHFDAHRGRFSAGGARPMADGCAACHDAVTFHPSTIDAGKHEAFGFKLAGAHRATPCFECHEELCRPPARIRLLSVLEAERPLTLAREHERCEACHRTPHGDQFDRGAATAGCEACHDVARFRPAPRFDHDRDSSFPLGRAHRGLACAGCHPVRPGADGVARATYRPVARACEACHRQAPTPGDPS